MKNISTVLTTLIFFTVMTTTAQQLNYKVYRANAHSFHVASTLIYGQEEAVLIDAQFTRADAYRVVADIIESGKSLSTIYVSHGDPDYYFGLEVFKSVFPDVTVYATPQTIAHIKKTYQKKLDFWGPKLGSNGSQNIVLPQVLQGNTIKLEEHSLEIKGLNGPTPERTYVWIPTIKTVVGGVNVYDNLHLWIADAGTPKERKAWLEILSDIENLKPEVVIAAHALDNSNLNINAVTFSKKYLLAYEKEAKKAKNSEELIAAMQKLYPKAGLSIALDIGSKVAKGEMKW
ncbi:MBL fold metallo-hydrolase [Aquimarina rhabdastrellae]